MVLYDAHDVESFRMLGNSPVAGAQLYGLCGLKHVGATAEASALRQRLMASQSATAIDFGCTGSGPKVPVSSLVVPKDNQPVSEFDSVCDALAQAGTRSPRNICDSGGARLTCR